MKKVLAVFDGFKLCKGTVNYAIEFAQSNGAHLTGVFLDAFFYRSYNLKKTLKLSSDPESTIKKLDEQDEVLRAKSAIEFEETCKQAGISYSIHLDHSIPLDELQYESMFADLVVISEQEKLTASDHHIPTGFIKNTLSTIQPPVLVVPDEYIEIKKVVFLYDGHPSSLYAIKMFSYIYDNLSMLPIEVVTVDERVMKEAEFPGSVLLMELMNLKFSSVTFNLLHGSAEEEIVSYLVSDKNQLVVLGAYRRSGFSRWLKQSMADTLMIALDIPLFVAHH
ncbi:universal stress protein [Pedobacter sp.]|uniref:universal stress protein n=1 Tax=Pedobacter sp. TaxID=1411316 RepID=UPI003D7F70F4